MIITVYTHEPLDESERGGITFSGMYKADLLTDISTATTRLRIMEPAPSMVGGWKTVREFRADEWKGYTVQNRRGNYQRQRDQASSAGTESTASAQDPSTAASGTSSSAPAPAMIPGGCA